VLRDLIGDLAVFVIHYTPERRDLLAQGTRHKLKAVPG
jgi:hypothetical protein